MVSDLRREYDENKMFTAICSPVRTLLFVSTPYKEDVCLQALFFVV